MVLQVRHTVEIENAIPNHVKENIVKNGYYLPDSMSQNTFVWFALDDIDFLEDTASGKDTLHGTGITMYQSESTNNPKEPLQLKRPPDTKDTKNRVSVDIQYCAKVEDKPKLSLTLSDVHEFGTEYKDIFWVCMNFKNSEKISYLVLGMLLIP